MVDDIRSDGWQRHAQTCGPRCATDDGEPVVTVLDTARGRGTAEAEAAMVTAAIATSGRRRARRRASSRCTARTWSGTRARPATSTPSTGTSESATSVGLPERHRPRHVTMAVVVRVVTDWVGDPGAVVEYGVRFTRPVVVPDPEGAVLEVVGTVAAKEDDGTVRVDLTATVDGQTVLAKARAVVRTGH